MENITIPMEEYKELLIIKGKYEELKSQCRGNSIILHDGNLKRIGDIPIEPYKITCEKEV